MLILGVVILKLASLGGYTEPSQPQAPVVPYPSTLFHYQTAACLHGMVLYCVMQWAPNPFRFLQTVELRSSVNSPASSLPTSIAIVLGAQPVSRWSRRRRRRRRRIRQVVSILAK